MREERIRPRSRSLSPSFFSEGYPARAGERTVTQRIDAARRVETAFGEAQTDTIIEVDALRTQQLRVGQLVGIRSNTDCFQPR
jgi:hypothetical protein